MPKNRLYRFICVMVVWVIAWLVGGLPLALGAIIAWIVLDVVYTLYLKVVFSVVRSAYRYGNHISIRHTFTNRKLTFYNPAFKAYSIVEFIRYRPSENAQQ